MEEQSQRPENEMGQEQKGEIVKSLEDEFSKPVPEEYLSLIGRSKLLTDSREGSWRLKHVLDNLKVQSAIKNSEFLDLGCGNRSSVYAPNAAFQSGAERYIGIDLAEQSDIGLQPMDIFKNGYELKNSIGPINVESEKQIYIQDDMLGALAKIKDQRKRFFLLSGLRSGSDDKKDAEINDSYFNALWTEMSRISIEGSAVMILSAGGIDPVSYRADKHAKENGFEELDNTTSSIFVFIKK